MIELAPAHMQPKQQEPVIAWLITVKQAAEILKVTTRTIHAHLATGALPSVKVGGARRIWMDDLLKFAGK
jgi:excisionase family DNA binding protein